MIEDKIFYLIKDVGVPTFLCGMMAIGWYKLGAKLLTVMGSNNEIIQKNTQVLERIIKLITK